MTGGDGSSNAADNTQELAELFDATLKFTSVLKKKGVSQSTLTVSLLQTVQCLSMRFLTLINTQQCVAGSCALPASDTQGEKLGLSPHHPTCG